MFVCFSLEMAFIIMQDIKLSSKSVTFLLSESFYGFRMHCKQERGRLSI